MFYYRITWHTQTCLRQVAGPSDFQRSPANYIFLQILGAMRVQSIVLEVLTPCLPCAAWLHLMGLVSAETTESWQPSRTWLFPRNDNLLPPEKSFYPQQGWAPAQWEALVLTLYTAQSRAHLWPLWPTQAANAKWCWNLTNGTLPSVA